MGGSPGTFSCKSPLGHFSTGINQAGHRVPRGPPISTGAGRGWASLTRSCFRRLLSSGPVDELGGGLVVPGCQARGCRAVSPDVGSRQPAVPACHPRVGPVSGVERWPCPLPTWKGQVVPAAAAPGCSKASKARMGQLLFGSVVATWPPPAHDS